MAGLSVSTGELVALGCALLWALNGLVLRTQLTLMSPAAMNAVRCGISGLLYCLLLPFHQPAVPLAQVPAGAWGLLLLSVIIAIVIGDTLYLTSLKNIGLARTMAISSTYPLSTLLFEYVLLQQPVTADLALGSILVVGGVVFLSGRHQEDEGAAPGRLRQGIAMALVTSLLWGLGTVLMRPPMEQLTPVQANAIRMPVVAGLLYGLRVLPSGERLALVHHKAMAIVALTGILGMGVGSYMFLYSLKAIGATKTVTLTATSPVFGLVLGGLFLKEKLTVRIALGTAACLAGVWVVL
ncbi:DMT family transporter [Candidatus Latescibacterota bacterium]